MRPAADTGVTLIELLVVVAVMSVLAVGISLPLRKDTAGAPADAARFTSLIDRSQTLAIHGQTRRGLRVTPKGVSLMQQTSEGWETSENTIRWRGRASFLATGPAATSRPLGAPDITFLPNGQTSAYEMRFFGRGTGYTLCQSDGWTGVTCATN
ncbi:hypothetical protein shim_37550 [Shimia sp. SK013]|uniref:prepilin-type N-terminal cleavage/methylation domain-containing protein n=1 Tax=Shimia sp. SK013 TaxID=1389006 RepID=UPI0006B5F6DF|nr:prepilin-type N-terminal cleavage/methylation domain-containing protein [Shimia sp. SK013]KPA19796.1 hypothetical protein shim_37550 [Shimia sp. SK013]